MNKFLLILNDDQGTERIPFYTKGTKDWTDYYKKKKKEHWLFRMRSGNGAVTAQVKRLLPTTTIQQQQQQQCIIIIIRQQQRRNITSERVFVYNNSRRRRGTPVPISRLNHFLAKNLVPSAQNGTWKSAENKNRTPVRCFYTVLRCKLTTNFNRVKSSWQK